MGSLGERGGGRDGRGIGAYVVVVVVVVTTLEWFVSIVSRFQSCSLLCGADRGLENEIRALGGAHRGLWPRRWWMGEEKRRFGAVACRCSARAGTHTQRAESQSRTCASTPNPSRRHQARPQPCSIFFCCLQPNDFTSSRCNEAPHQATLQLVAVFYFPLFSAQNKGLVDWNSLADDGQRPSRTATLVGDISKNLWCR